MPYIILNIPSATWTHKFVGLFQKPGFSMHVAKKPGLYQTKRSFFSGYWALYMISKIAYGNLLGFGVG